MPPGPAAARPLAQGDRLVTPPTSRGRQGAAPHYLAFALDFAYRLEAQCLPNGDTNPQKAPTPPVGGAVSSRWRTNLGGSRYRTPEDRPDRQGRAEQGQGKYTSENPRCNPLAPFWRRVLKKNHPTPPPTVGPGAPLAPGRGEAP